MSNKPATPSGSLEPAGGPSEPTAGVSRHVALWSFVCVGIIAAVAAAVVLVTRSGAHTPPVRQAVAPLGTVTAPTNTPNTSPGAAQPTGIPGNWRLVLNSTFNGDALDTTIWRAGWFGNGITGPVNPHEEACYSPDNVTFSDAWVNLAITQEPSTCGGVRKPYTGALLSSNPADGRANGGFQFKYGVLEAKAYIPSAGRLIADWPTVMALGQQWPKYGEDDVMEGLSGTPCFHFHNQRGQAGGCAAWVTAGWHTFASVWKPNSVEYFYDGVLVGKVVKGVTSRPQYIVLLNTVSARAPQVARADVMRVAYVRVWQ
jgi:beta-glucanase (GH16 family)